MKTVFLVDDSGILRNDLKRMIASIPNLHIVGEAVDSTSAVRLIDEIRPNIVILDIDLLQGNGIEVLTKIKNRNQKPIIIMFTNYTQEALKKAAAKLGANYFFDKSRDIDGLFEILGILSLS